jgi:hypothetical protein
MNEDGFEIKEESDILGMINKIKHENINYIKTNIYNLFKTIVYVIILKNYRVKASNTEAIEYNLDNNYIAIIDSIKILELNYLLELINDFYKFASLKLKP